MSDDIGLRFERVTSSARVPHADFTAIVRGGRRRRRRALLASAVASVVLAGGAFAVGGRLVSSEGPGPGNPPDVPPAREVLVPDVMEGPSPMQDLAAPEDLEAARAVTVAFHAVLERTGSYELDYQDVRRGNGGWVVTFVGEHGDEPLEQQLEGQLSERRRQLRKNVQMLRARAAQLAEVLRARARTSGPRREQLKGRSKMIRRSLASSRALARRLEGQLDALRDRIARGGSLVEVDVGRDGDSLFVAAVRAESPDAAGLGLAEGYFERISAIDSWGADYYAGDFEEPGVVDDVGGYEMSGFWTGPIPSSYEEQCRAELVDRAGDVVWRQRPTLYTDAPASEDARDGWTFAFGIDYEGPRQGLSVVLRCSWRAPPVTL